MSSHQEHHSPGLDDGAVKEAHEFIHRAETQQHRHDAEQKHGLPDSAIEAEHEFEDMVEGNTGTPKNASKPLGEKVKETLEKLVPGSK